MPVCVHAEGRFLNAFGGYLSTVESAAVEHCGAGQRCRGVMPKSSGGFLRDDGTIARKQRQGNNKMANQHRDRDTYRMRQLFHDRVTSRGIPGSRDISVDFYISPTLAYVECFMCDVWFHTPGIDTCRPLKGCTV